MAPAVVPRGVTLVELLLVLVLLVVIAALAAPALTGSFASTRLRRAADEVVGAWSKARRHAIDSGLTYQFRFKRDDNVYRIEPFTTIDAVALTGDSYTSSTGAAATSTSTRATSANAAGSPSSTPNAAAQQQDSYEEESDEDGLPDEVVFQGGQIAVNDPLQEETEVAKLETRGESWGRPILFFPDGTTSNASILLKNTRDQYIRVTLRGLTGVGRATSVLSSADAMKPNSRRN